MKNILFVIITLMLLVILYILFFTKDSSTDPTYFSVKVNSNNAPIDIDTIPKNIYEAICKIGSPILVSSSEHTEGALLIIFNGPFKELSNSSSEIHQYLQLYLASDQDEYSSSSILLSSIEHLKVGELSSEKNQYNLPILKGVPDKLSKLTEVMGKWDVLVEKKSPKRRRLIYKKKICLGSQFIYGAYFDIDDEDRIQRAKGLKTINSVEMEIQNLKKLSPNKKPIKYTENKPNKGSAIDVITQLVLLREAGQKDAAMDLVSDKLESEFIRNEVTSQKPEGAAIRMESFYYQVTENTRDIAYITVSYHLQNGSLIDSKHKLIFNNKGWKVRY